MKSTQCRISGRTQYFEVLSWHVTGRTGKSPWKKFSQYKQYPNKNSNMVPRNKDQKCYCLVLWINNKKQSFLRNYHWTTQKIPYRPQNSKVHYYVQNSSQLYLHFTLRYLFRFSDYNFIYILHFSHACYMFHQSHPPQSDHPNIWYRIQLWNLTDIQVLWLMLTCIIGYCRQWILNKGSM